ncbi:MAG: TonB-dependent receptor [Leptospiraceae bacterium]|nr:TonB-dependent receptor [Leptospiraceae bacterium]
MRKANHYFDIEKFSEDERRLTFSAGIVFVFMSFFFAHLFTKNMLWKLLGSDAVVEIKSKEEIEKEKVYEVLLEQEFADKTKKDEIKALSDQDAAGTGGITEKEGFHTNSPFREFIFGSNPSPALKENEKEKNEKEKEEELHEVGIYKNDPMTAKNQSENTPNSSYNPWQVTKIPFNYRFEQDFLFRWDGARALSLPRKKLAGYQYFKKMLKQIEGSFAPPGGGNFAYRDMAGTVIREGIIPGETKVLFMLSENGQVIDLKKVTSQGQEIVDRACLDSLRGQNFGPVPEEVKVNGMIFGINFIFPGRVYYR